MIKRSIAFALGFLFLVGCQSKTKDSKTSLEGSSEVLTIGKVTLVDDAFRDIISEGASIELLGDGFDWTEGPLWIENGKYLLFSDIPPNSIFKWSEAEGISLYLKPSGYTGETERSGELGSNGLLLDENGKLVLCQHGDRRLARMESPLDTPSAEFTTLADRYNGMRFNSPNDAVYDSKGNLYFTDPPYGLEGNMADPIKEIPFQGVYKVSADGSIELIDKDLERPNGIALSPDEETLYVANSFGERPIIKSYKIADDGKIGEGKVFFDSKYLRVDGAKGSPDGLKVSSDGILFATGPGGVLVIDENGKHLGTISTGEATSNCALDDKEEFLYITSDMYLARIALN